MENFADLLDIPVVNLQEAGRFDELKNGSLYNKLQRKMTESMLSMYHRWIFESGKTESVEYLREWILQESEFQTIASETIHGLSTNTSSNSRNYKGNLWRCDEFRKLTVHKRWDTAKRLQLCYRCLGHDHVGRQCPRSIVCNLGGRKEVHNILLDRDKQSFSEPKVPVRTESNTKQNYATEKKEDTAAATEGEWFRELDELCCFKIPRCFQLNDDIISTSLLTFSDAYHEAYGSFIYARQEYMSGMISTRLIAAKSSYSFNFSQHSKTGVDGSSFRINISTFS
ncbi:unnamed protein product [Mytilus edulis]|uniref:CCHC-type domain-containing protein n=1 Tax=Mytilus edulis TaxID=6550 RepID=A0A8S3S166_MYTED|nr:unnamed protein product [Mytilus edulis]